MTKVELINKIRNNRSFDLRASEFYEPFDISDETIKDMADDFYYLLKDVLNYLVGKEEPTNNSFENEVKKLWEEINTGHSYSIVDSYNQFYGLCTDIADWKKEQMMAKAVDVEVKVDAGGYPYIPQMELYDYEKDIPLAKEGDKYKVILIKEG
jgi:hypothetical protein